jgi:hypothetical protein
VSRSTDFTQEPTRTTQNRRKRILGMRLP